MKKRKWRPSKRDWQQLLLCYERLRLNRHILKQLNLTGLETAEQTKLRLLAHHKKHYLAYRNLLLICGYMNGLLHSKGHETIPLKYEGRLHYERFRRHLLIYELTTYAKLSYQS